MKTLLSKIVIEKTDNIFLQLVRYTFVGGIAFTVDFALLFVLTEYIGFHYLLSASLSFIAGLIVNYWISVKWVFNHSKMLNKKIEFLSYAAIGIIGLGFTELFMWIFTGLLVINYLLSKILTTVIVYFWNFLMRKFLLF